MASSFSSSPRKRTSSQVEFEELSSITEPENKAVVHGIVTSLSPMKSDSKKCFDGYLRKKNQIRWISAGKTRQVS